MTEFLLIVAFFTGPALNAAYGVSVSQIGPFASEQECQAAGAQVQAAFSDSAKSSRFVCLKRTVAKPA